jgi:hypothetical protein
MGQVFPPEYFGFLLSVSFHCCSITRRNVKLIIFITRLHNKPQGCGASVASAAGPFTTKRNILTVFSTIGWVNFGRLLFAKVRSGHVLQVWNYKCSQERRVVQLTRFPKRRTIFEIIKQSGVKEVELFLYACTGHTQNNGAVLIVVPIKTAPFFCVCPVFFNVLRILFCF